MPAARSVCPCLVEGVDTAVDLAKYVPSIREVLTSAKPGRCPGEAKRSGLTTFGLGGGVSLLLWTGKPPSPAAAPGGGKKAARAPKFTPATAQLVSAVAAFAPKDEVSRRSTFKVAAPLAPATRDTSVTAWEGDCGLVDISIACAALERTLTQSEYPAHSLERHVGLSLVLELSLLRMPLPISLA